MEISLDAFLDEEKLSQDDIEHIHHSGAMGGKSFDPARGDTDWNLAAARGIEAAMRDFGDANRPYNVAVLPGTNGSLYVYLYPAQVKAEVYPLGADIRYRFSSEGAKITEKRPLQLRFGVRIHRQGLVIWTNDSRQFHGLYAMAFSSWRKEFWLQWLPISFIEVLEICVGWT